MRGNTRTTDREFEVLDLAGAGCPDPKIAANLSLSREELRAVWVEIRAKLGASSRAHAVGLHLADRVAELQRLLDGERRDHVAAENALRATHARFTALMDVMPEAVLVADGRTGIIKMVNLHAGELFRYPVEKLVGLAVEELVPPRHRAIHPAYRIGFLSSVRKREMGYHPPISALRGDGTRVDLAIALTATTADEDVMVVCTEYADWAAAPSHEIANRVSERSRKH